MLDGHLQTAGLVCQEIILHARLEIIQRWLVGVVIVSRSLRPLSVLHRPISFAIRALLRPYDLILRSNATVPGCYVRAGQRPCEDGLQ